MQNEPNFGKAQMNVTSFYAMDYEKKSNWTLGENEPKTNPIYPCIASGEAGSNPIKANFPKSQNERNILHNKEKGKR